MQNSRKKRNFDQSWKTSHFRPQTKSLDEDEFTTSSIQESLALHLFHDVSAGNGTQNELNFSGMHQNWGKALESPRKTFSVKRGKITVRQAGIYYVYAQVILKEINSVELIMQYSTL